MFFSFVLQEQLENNVGCNLACHMDTSEHSVYIASSFQLDPCDCLPPFRHELCTLTEKHEEALMISSW